MKKTSILISIYLESKDRYNNAKTTLRYLNHHFQCDVLIYESQSTEGYSLDFLHELNNIKIKHFLFPKDTFFHKTRYLNYLLDRTETPFFLIYDIDVLLPVDSYLGSEYMLETGEADLLYPFGFGNNQYQVQRGFSREEFETEFDIKVLEKQSQVFRSEYGHCVFAKTDLHRKLGGDNENFLSWGPEDIERSYRYRKMGFSVIWLQDRWVYHMEHERGKDSGQENPFFISNWEIFNEIKQKSAEDLLNYYKDQKYLLQYSNFKV